MLPVQPVVLGIAVIERQVSPLSPVTNKLLSTLWLLVEVVEIVQAEVTNTKPMSAKINLKDF
jgi:hypothetical protein